MSVIPAGPIDHVGIAVHDLDAACDQYVRVMGARVVDREVVEAQAVEVAFLELPGDTRIELIAPIASEGAVVRFLDKRGEGMHHICVRVDDIEAALASLGEAEVPLIDEVPRIGAEGARIAFVHPRAMGGVLLELKQKRRDEPA